MTNDGTTNRPTALVTGSGKDRVGRSIALELAAAGHNVVIHYRTSEQPAQQSAQEVKHSGVESIALQADLRDEEQVDRLIQQTVKQFGSLDVLVCAAALWTKKPLTETTAHDVEQEFRVNALGTFLCCQKAGLVMAEQPQGGSIILIGDWAVARPYSDHAAYFVSKGAIPTMTRTLAVELAAKNSRIRVNAVHPGPVMLPDDLPDEEKQQAIDATLVKREGSPQNVAHAVRFLVENDFVTGVNLPVDGGRTIC